MDDAAKRQALVRQFEEGRDLDKTHEIYRDDAILEFPQSGERFVGKENFLTWRKQYPARVTYGIRRITTRSRLLPADARCQAGSLLAWLLTSRRDMDRDEPRRDVAPLDIE
jgi:hypothetical protein